jgi:hypothetical protein
MSWKTRLLNSGYVRLGVSNWESKNVYGGGVPQKDMALAYARAIGADIIIYADRSAPNEYDTSEHLVGFYANAVKRAAPARRPTSEEATKAINRAQDAWHEPHVKGGVRYDPQTDTYNWIGPKYGEHRSKSAEWFSIISELTYDWLIKVIVAGAPKETGRLSFLPARLETERKRYAFWHVELPENRVVTTVQLVRDPKHPLD